MKLKIEKLKKELNEKSLQKGKSKLSEELFKYKFLYYWVMIDNKKWFACKYSQHGGCIKNNIDCDFYHQHDNGSEDYEQAYRGVYEEFLKKFKESNQ